MPSGTRDASNRAIKHATRQTTGLRKYILSGTMAKRSNHCPKFKSSVVTSTFYFLDAHHYCNCVQKKAPPCPWNVKEPLLSAFDADMLNIVTILKYYHKLLWVSNRFCFGTLNRLSFCYVKFKNRTFQTSRFQKY
jgi:hypothetical protein